MSNSVLRIPGKGTRLRRLALAKVRDLRAAGMSYREIGWRFHAGYQGEREHPAAEAATSSAAPPPSAAPATTRDHWRFLCALDAVPVGLFFFGPAQRVLHVNEPAIRMLEMDPEEERIRRELDAFVRNLCLPEPPPLSNGRREMQEIAVHELRTAAGRYRLRGSAIGLDLLGTGSTLLVSLEAAPPAPISPEAARKRFGLTRKEAQVALLLAQRRSTPEIARELHLSPHTVRHHVRHAMEKLGVHSRREVAAALETGRNGAGGEK